MEHKKYILFDGIYILERQDKDKIFEVVLAGEIKKFSGDHIYLVINSSSNERIFIDTLKGFDETINEQSDDYEKVKEWQENIIARLPKIWN